MPVLTRRPWKVGFRSTKICFRMSGRQSLEPDRSLMSRSRSHLFSREPEDPPESPAGLLANSHWHGVLLGLAVGIVAIVPFLPVLCNGWVIFDDDENFLDNVDYRGLDWANISGPGRRSSSASISR